MKAIRLGKEGAAARRAPALARARRGGAIASSIGSASTVPMPRRNVRRGIWYFAVIFLILIFLLIWIFPVVSRLRLSPGERLRRRSALIPSVERLRFRPARQPRGQS